MTEPSGAGRPTVMVLGAGEYGRELIPAFQRLGAVVVAADPDPDAPALGVADRSATVALDDADALAALIAAEAPRYVVVQTAAAAAEALIGAAAGGTVEVFPTPRAARLALDREGLRRLAADELGLPTVPFWFAGSVEELAAVAGRAGFPLVVGPTVAAPGEGRSVLLRRADIAPAWQRAVAAGRLPQLRVLVESLVEFDHEVLLPTVRTVGPAGPVLHFGEPIGHCPGEDGALTAWQPQPLLPAALEAARSVAARIVTSLGGRGVFGVELLVRGDEVYFAGVRVGPSDAGLVTLRSQRLSQFELHARAVLGLAVDTVMISPAAAEVHYRPVGADPAAALRVAESDVRLYPRAGTGEPTAVVLATAPDPATARQRARRISTALTDPGPGAGAPEFGSA